MRLERRLRHGLTLREREEERETERDSQKHFIFCWERHVCEIDSPTIRSAHGVRQLWVLLTQPHALASNEHIGCEECMRERLAGERRRAVAAREPLLDRGPFVRLPVGCDHRVDEQARGDRAEQLVGDKYISHRAAHTLAIGLAGSLAVGLAGGLAIGLAGSLARSWAKLRIFSPSDGSIQ